MGTISPLKKANWVKVSSSEDKICPHAMRDTTEIIEAIEMSVNELIDEGAVRLATQMRPCRVGRRAIIDPELTPIRTDTRVH